MDIEKIIRLMITATVCVFVLAVILSVIIRGEPMDDYSKQIIAGIIMAMIVIISNKKNDKSV